MGNISDLYFETKKDGYHALEIGSFTILETWKLGSNPEVKILGNERLIKGETNGKKWCMVVVDVVDMETKEICSVRVPTSIETLVRGMIFLVKLQAINDGKRIVASLIDDADF